MRINGLEGLSIYKGMELNKTKKTNPVMREDEYHISELGSDFQFAMKKVKEKELDRAEKVESIKRAVENGTYNVSARDVASKILSDLSNQFSL